MTPRGLAAAALISAGLTAMAITAGAQSSNEDVARRQLESGRAFARQGNYTEALKDFRAVADTHAATSVADNALLEIARYYIDIAGDLEAAAEAVEAIVTKYATSDSAPDAYVLAGRLALSRGRQAADLDAALASFERVSRLFPTSEAVPRALTLAGETLWYARRFDDAVATLLRVIAESPSSEAAADAHLVLGRVLVSQGDPVQAMETLQQVATRWPGSTMAQAALAHITLLHRLYVRAPRGPAFVAAPDTAGPARPSNVVALTLSGQQGLFAATSSGVVALTPDSPDRPPAVARPRGVLTDRSGRVAAFDAGALHLSEGSPLSFGVPQPNGATKALSNLQGVAQFSNGDWLVADGDDRSLHRFSTAGSHLGAFAPGRMTHVAILPTDEVAGLDRDQRAVVVFDVAGQALGRIPLRAAGYDLQDAEGLSVDAFGHLYVLARTAIGVFSAFPAPAAGQPRAVTVYPLLALFAPPQNDPGGFRRATAFALDPSGAAWLYDERANRLTRYR